MSLSLHSHVPEAKVQTRAHVEDQTPKPLCYLTTRSVTTLNLATILNISFTALRISGRTVNFFGPVTTALMINFVV